MMFIINVKPIKYIIVVLIFMNGINAFSQDENPWILGAGFNTVDNSGTRFKQLLNITDNWNFSRLLKFSAEKRFLYDYGIETSITLNKFNKGKMINSVLNYEEVNYVSVDIMLKNYVSNYFSNPQHATYTGYIIGGLGNNFLDGVLNQTINVGLGFNIRIKYDLRINFQTLGKFSIDDNSPGNSSHLQHSISIIKWIKKTQK